MGTRVCEAGTLINTCSLTAIFLLAADCQLTTANFLYQGMFLQFNEK
jgi:hypothetical protein